MRPIEIETWALRILESVKNGGSVEDSLVELKARWPESKKAARQLAGHANAARGARILWLIGVDEKYGIDGANYSELSAWYTQLESEFDTLAPALQNVNVAFDGKSIAALCFDTQRAPYVVKNPAFNTPQGGAVELEVPWREGNRTRSATRSDLITVLAPIRLQPSFEPLEGSITFKSENLQRKEAASLSVHLQFYIAPKTDQLLVFPFHKMRGLATALELTDELKFEQFNFYDASSRSSWLALTRRHDEHSVTVNARLEPLEITTSELIVRAARKVTLHCSIDPTGLRLDGIGKLRFELSLTEAQDNMPCRLSAMFQRRHDSTQMVWDLQRESHPTI
jgi:hypothetical protein